MRTRLPPLGRAGQRRARFEHRPAHELIGSGQWNTDWFAQPPFRRGPIPAQDRIGPLPAGRYGGSTGVQHFRASNQGRARTDGAGGPQTSNGRIRSLSVFDGAGEHMATQWVVQACLPDVLTRHDPRHWACASAASSGSGDRRTPPAGWWIGRAHPRPALRGANRRKRPEPGGRPRTCPSAVRHHLRLHRDLCRCTRRPMSRGPNPHRPLSRSRTQVRRPSQRASRRASRRARRRSGRSRRPARPLGRAGPPGPRPVRRRAAARLGRTPRRHPGPRLSVRPSAAGAGRC